MLRFVRLPSLSPSFRWLLPGAAAQDAVTVRELSRQAGIAPVAARVLLARGLSSPQAVAAFLQAGPEAFGAPLRLKGVAEAVQRIQEAIAGRQPILLYGDYDVDGTAAIVILQTALRLLGADSRYHVPHRLRDGYGMREEVMQTATEAGVKLVISVDTGIRAGEVVAYANELGIDVIVTDHHLPEGELPPACAVVNPNRPDCDYPEKNLCGAAVAWKLAAALFAAAGMDPARQQKLLDSLLKLTAIATIADVVPLTGENRAIVQRGLDGLRDPRNPGLKALFQVAGLPIGEAPSARQVAFQLAPRLNAAGRMQDARRVIELFLATAEEQALPIAQELDALNKERQETEAQIRDAILAACEVEPENRLQPALVFAGQGWHKGVVGIVASRLVERYGCPVFVLAIDPETGSATGSGRSPKGFHLLEALEAMPELFEKFGGHRQAAGLTLPANAVDTFRQKLQAYAAPRWTAEQRVPELELDAEALLPELTDEAVADLLRLAPFGQGNPPPLLLLPAVQLAGAPLVKNEKHLFLKVRQEGEVHTVKGWNLGHLAEALQANDRVDLAVTLEEDAWGRQRGLRGWQLVLKDLRPTSMQ